MGGGSGAGPSPMQCPECGMEGREASIQIGPIYFAGTDCPGCDLIAFVPSWWPTCAGKTRKKSPATAAAAAALGDNNLASLVDECHRAVYGGKIPLMADIQRLAGDGRNKRGPWAWFPMW